MFEKHLANLYGTWRLHAKIIPDWMPAKYVSLSALLCWEVFNQCVAREPGRLTYLVPKEKEKKAKAKPDEAAKEPEKDSKDVDEEDNTMYDRFGRILSGRK